MNKQSQWLFEVSLVSEVAKHNNYKNFEWMADMEAPTVVLQSPRFRNDSRLQTAANNRPPMRQGERGVAVQKLQQALIELGFPMPVSTQRRGTPDGIYGAETAATVRKIQKKYGLRVDGVAGRETLSKLDQLSSNLFYCRLDIAHPLDVKPSSSSWINLEGSTTTIQRPSLDNVLLQKAFQDSRRTLRLVRNALANLLVGFANEKQSRSLNDFQKRVLISVGRWLKVDTGNTPTARARTADVVRRAIKLIDKNLAVKTSNGQDPPFKRTSATSHATTFGSVDRGIDFGDPFFTEDGPNCRRDVVTHEFFHFVGVKHGGAPLNSPTIRTIVTTPELALDSADHLTQLVSEITNGRTDACTRRGD